MLSSHAILKTVVPPTGVPKIFRVLMRTRQHKAQYSRQTMQSIFFLVQKFSSCSKVMPKHRLEACPLVNLKQRATNINTQATSNNLKAPRL